MSFLILHDTSIRYKEKNITNWTVQVAVDDSARWNDSLWFPMTGVRTLFKKDDPVEGVTKGVPWSETDKGTVAAPAAALEGVWVNSVEFRFSFTER